MFINDCFPIASPPTHTVSITAVNFLLCKIMSFFIPIKMVFYLPLFSNVFTIIHLSSWNPSLYLNVFLHALSQVFLSIFLFSKLTTAILPKIVSECFRYYNRYFPYFKAYVILSKPAAEKENLVTEWYVKCGEGGQECKALCNKRSLGPSWRLAIRWGNNLRKIQSDWNTLHDKRQK